MKRLLICCLLFGIIATVAPASEAPDVTWDLGHIFATDEEWERGRERFVARLEEARTAKMLNFLELDCALEQLFFRLIYYADLNMATNVNEPRFREMQGRMLGLLGQWQSIIAPMDSIVLEFGEERFDEYLTAEPGLARPRSSPSASCSPTESQNQADRLLSRRWTRR